MLMQLLAAATVTLAGLYLLVLGVAAFAAPALARRFLFGFAGSARLHALELGVRVWVGGAFVLHAERLPWSAGFAVAGWVLLATTAALALVPWRLHRRFAAWSVERAVRHLALLGAASFAFGCVVLVAVVRSAA